jgi:hypothetical protein
MKGPRWHCATRGVIVRSWVIGMIQVGAREATVLVGAVWTPGSICGCLAVVDE